MSSRALVDQYREVSMSLEALAQRDLEAFWPTLDHSDVAGTRVALTGFVDALTATYGPPAALLAANFYDAMRAESANATGKYRATLAPVTSNVEQINQSMRWAVTPLTEDRPDRLEAALSNVGGVAQNLLADAGRNTVAYNTTRDPSRVHWARVLGHSASGNCDFCVMLSSRGAVYRSAATAGEGHHYHDRCHCTPTPVWDGDNYPDGYDPDALYDEWQNRLAAAGA